MNFPQHLIAWRVFRGLTQNELAQKSGVPRPNLVAIEQGKRSCNLKTLSSLAQALQISSGRLIDDFPAKYLSLTRHEIDLLVSAFFEKKQLGAKLDFLRSLFDEQVYPTLRAIGIPPHKKTSKSMKKSRAKIPLSLLVSPDLQKQIYRRFNKQAANLL